MSETEHQITITVNDDVFKKLQEATKNLFVPTVEYVAKSIIDEWASKPS